jgi:uncharacterized phiE125 gp8 family phage protein
MYDLYCAKDEAYNTYLDQFPIGTLPVTLAEVKTHLRIPSAFTIDDDYLTSLIDTAARVAEAISNRIFIQRSITTFRDCFTAEIELRRSPFVSLTTFKYYSDDELIDVPTEDYYINLSNDYSSILLKHQRIYPTDIDIRRQAIAIEFIAGYSTLPNDLKIALLNHIAWLYENRGDCDPVQMLMEDLLVSVPSNSRTVYNLHKIIMMH